MQTISAEEFKKKYGKEAEKAFEAPAPKKDPLASVHLAGPSYGSAVADAFKGGVSKIKQGIDEAKPSGGKGVGGLVTGVGKILGGATEAITSPIAPVFDATVGSATRAIGNKIGDIPAVQDFAQTPAGEATAKTAETVGNYAEAAGLVGGAVGAKGLKSSVETPKVEPTVNPVAEVPKPTEVSPIEKAASYTQSAVRDVIPTKENIISHQVARALDLTPGDLSNIAKSTGNDVGTFLADNNLIRANKEMTTNAVKDFFEKNHFDVRAEIARVQKTYTPRSVPRYVDSLKAIQSRVAEVPGLESEASTISKLLIKKEITLEDVQQVKELMDEHFNLYKVTGDVGEGVQKQGLANLRSALKGFIEKEVKNATGEDISALNNNVATAKTIINAIETRTSRGITRSMITPRDFFIGAGLSFIGSPLLGAAAVLVGKILSSATVRLRFARFIDSLSDAQKAKIDTALKSGVVPPEVTQALEEPI